MELSTLPKRLDWVLSRFPASFPLCPSRLHHQGLFAVEGWGQNANPVTVILAVCLSSTFPVPSASLCCLLKHLLLHVYAVCVEGAHVPWHACHVCAFAHVTVCGTLCAEPS